MEINEINDLNALYKALLFAKFPVDNDKAFEISGSNIVADLLKRIAAEMDVNHDLLIDNDKEKLNYVKGLILSKPELQSARNKLKRGIIENLVFPYKCSKEVLDELISLGD